MAWKDLTPFIVWLDNDGTPLPDSLPGYTGRLAISTGGATEDFSGNFEIKPGYQTEFVQLNNALADLTTEHFYVQVIGENFDGNPSFASPGAGTGILQTRPAKYVPIKVPLFNELATLEAQNALRDARAQGVQNLPEKAEPVYQWVYRPEMQFSVYDLTVRDIKLEGGENNAFNFSIIDLTNPVIGVDTIIDVFLTLNSPDSDALPFFGPGQDLVLKIGENENSISTNADGEQTFIEIDTDYFTELSVDDFLTISIFLNNDSANTLWQFGFATLDVDVDSDNNNGLGMPDRSPEEELVEDVPGQPGKILLANTDDTDSDGIPDFADFDPGTGFVPMVIEVPKDVDIATAKIKFIYEQSDPNNITIDTSGLTDLYIPDDGYLRIWNKNGTQARSSNDINGGGDFIRVAQIYNLSLFNISEDLTITAYLELVRPKGIDGSLSVKIDLIE